MKEYIDRKNLLKNLNRFAPEKYDALVNDLIMKEPVAIVQCENIHACWILIEHKGIIECSHCGKTFGKGNYFDVQKFYYCPKCGAIMERNEKDKEYAKICRF